MKRLYPIIVLGSCLTVAPMLGQSAPKEPIAKSATADLLTLSQDELQDLRKRADNTTLSVDVRANALFRILTSELESQDIPAAEQTLQKWNKVCPGRSEAYVAMGRAYVEQKVAAEKAVELFNKVLPKTSGNDRCDLKYWRGRAYLLAGRNAEAIADLRSAVKITFSGKQQDGLRYFNEDLGARWVMLGNALEAARKFPEAVSVYREALILPFYQRADARAGLERAFNAGNLGTPKELAVTIAEAKEIRAKAAVALYQPKSVDRLVEPFEFTTLNGERYTSEQLRGRTIVLNYWAIT